MTAVKERFTKILPELQRDYLKMPDSDVQQIINVWVKVRPEMPERKPKRTDIADSGLDFGPEFTDENHDERVAQFFAMSKGIEVDEQAIKDLREASMI